MTLLEQHVGGTAQALGHTNTSTGERFITGSVLMDQKINTIKLQLKIAEAGMSPSGDITFKAWTQAGSPLHTFGTYDASLIGNDWEVVSPDNPTAYDPENGLQSGTILGCEFAGSSSDYLHQNQSSSNVYPYGNWYKNPASVPESKTTDLWFTVDYATPTPATTGTRLPPPPMVAYF